MGFLEILGIIFVVLLLVLLFFGIKAFRWYKKNLSDSMKMEQVLKIYPPVRFDLFKRDEAPDCHFKERFAADEALLQKAGFVHDGWYGVTHGLMEMTISLWAKPTSGVVAALYEGIPDVEELTDEQKTAASQYAADLAITFTEGGSLTISNSIHANLLPRPAEHPIVYEDAESLKPLFAALKQQLPQGQKIKKIDDPQHLYKVANQDYFIWLWEEEQIRSDKVKAAFDMAKLPLTEGLILQMVEHGKEETTYLLSDQVMQRLSKSSHMSAERWEAMRENAVVVHAKMSAEMLETCLYELLDEVPDGLVARIDKLWEDAPDRVDDPLAFFAQKLDELELTHKVKIVANMQTPVPARVYLKNPV